MKIHVIMGFPDGSVVKNPPAMQETWVDSGSIPESGRSPGEGNGYSLQCSCLENSMARGASQSTVHGIPEWDTTEQLFFSPFLLDSLGFFKYYNLQPK